MRIDALEYRTEDKQDILIVVDFVNSVGYTNCNNWRIADIGYKTSRQRVYRYLSSTIRESWEYRKLNSEDRDDFVLNKYIEFVGEDKLKEAIIAAYKSLEPNLEKLDVSKI